MTQQFDHMKHNQMRSVTMRAFSRNAKMIKTNSKLPGVTFLCITAVIIGLVVSPALSSPRKHRSTIVNQEEGQQQSFMKANVSIEKKSMQHIFTLGKDYAINAETVIVGSDGKEIKLKKMLVPCDAEVLYLIENGVRTAKRINVKRVASDASWQWISEKPE